MSPSLLSNDPLWFKNAIIYEVPVRAFADSNGDGIGDFRGLTEKLDYLQDLGITAVWLLPFFPSPLKDDGYDIADYTNVNPIYGTLDDFKQFLEAAHQRGIRVIIELIINHTSDQHPWFQRARRAPKDSVERNFYVWSDTPEKYGEARIIFQDFETSNWAWDPIAKAYYWHRFYSHQPDLNYDNLAVQEAVFKVLDFWLSLGVDGLRMDAVPYLYEREGTHCENLPETHAFLKKLRRYVDERYPNRMLLAEANQWPEDAAAYYGEGDECHMNFHFPLMPRLFMALRMEDCFPITDILQQTPAIPDNCQWGLFLRNHDELTLEMVTDEDRDFMYRVYAQDPEMRVNLGIRRRLAPLLGNDRRQIELLNCLLLSLPGTPVLYYGDEIGMGDNVYVGDRNGVRTPMQWSADRNAGFSRATPHRLYLPVIVESEYHYEAINVEAQRANPNSLWFATRRLIGTRKRFQALGKGSFELLHSENRKVFAFTRTYGDEHILIVSNLSRFVQTVELDLSAFQGMVPVEIFGRTEFPPITDSAYFISISPYASYWFTLTPQPGASLLPRSQPQLLTLTVAEDWKTIFFQRQLKETLETVLPNYLAGHHWFNGKTRKVLAAYITDTIILPVPAGDRSLSPESPQEVGFVLLQVDYVQGTSETYLLLLTYTEGELATRLLTETPAAVVARVQLQDHALPGVLFTATVDKTILTAVLQTIAQNVTVSGVQGRLVSTATELFTSLGGEVAHLEPTVMKGQHNNTLVVYSDSGSLASSDRRHLILKLFRRLEEGMNPDLEMRHFLDEQQRFTQIPSIAGWLEYRRDRGAPITIGVLQEYTPDARSTWDYSLDRLRDYFEYVSTHETIQMEVPLPDLPLVELQAVFAESTSQEIEAIKQEDRGIWTVEPGSPSDSLESELVLARRTIGSYLANAQLLGQRTAELHLALTSDPTQPEFAPEPFNSFYQRSIYQYARNLTGQTLLSLRQRLKLLPPHSQELAQRVLNHQDRIMDCYQLVLNQKITALRTRCHGDYHLEQVLFTGRDFIIIDFEGDPKRTLSERRMKRSPLRDVAEMLQSFYTVASLALSDEVESGMVRPEQLSAMEQWKEFWCLWVSAAFLSGYLTTLRQKTLVPDNPREVQILLDVYLLEHVVTRLSQALDDRPTEVESLLQRILQLQKLIPVRTV